MLARHSCQTWRVNEPRTRLQSAVLYLVCDIRSDEFVRSALTGGVDIVQLRVKPPADDETILAAARRYRRLCDEAGALFIVNDRPDLAVTAGADGVHLGQDDTPVDEARETVGPERLIGLSTHSPAQIDAVGDADVDYIGVGPVHATPTKPGRPAVGLELVRYAARESPVPFFAIGGLDSGNIEEVQSAGASRVAVVRALTEAAEPQRAARYLADTLAAQLPSEVDVGSA
jgi:thiamine-phosphate pyrophosphorylase